MINVPKDFIPVCILNYPIDNIPLFERFYFENYVPTETERIYLPIQWTAYYVNHRFGKNPSAIRRLQKFLNTLDTSKKYYTIIQYDDGILNDVNHLDLKVFAMSGGRIDYPLPLLCRPHEFTFSGEKKYLANFIGRPTHPIRKKVVEAFSGKNDCYISEQAHSLKDYCQIISESVFTLCPRGYGQTSFRICEALQYGSIPVYISDEFIEPHRVNFNSYGLRVSNISHDVLKIYSEDDIMTKQERCYEVYNKYYTFQKNKELIEKNV